MYENLSDDALLSKYKSGVKSETKMIADNLGILFEIDRRRSYLKLNQTSLFQFLTVTMGYTNGAAQYRIEAIRLMAEVPEVHEDLRTGELNLTQISMLATSARESERQGRRVNKFQKRKVLDAIRSKTVEQSQQKVAEILKVTPKARDKKCIQADESMRIETSLNREQQELVDQVKQMISHTHPNPTFAELFEILAKHYIKKAATKSVVKQSKKPGYVPAKIRREVFAEQKSCQMCGSRHQTQVDHKIAKWKGGTSEKTNLQVLCGVHNRLKFESEIYEYAEHRIQQIRSQVQGPWIPLLNQ